MKRFQLFLVALVFLFNLIIAKPSFADRPPFVDNPDYIEVTQNINDLLAVKDNPPEGTTTEEIQKRLSELEFQKYTLETGVNWGQCTNETGQTVAVYGSKLQKLPSSYDNALYFLANGQTTEEQWDCDGVYLPGEVKVTGIDSAGNPVAIKIVDGTQLVVKTNPDTGEIELNVSPAKIFKTGEVNWFIPDVSQTAIATKIPNAPTNESD